MTTEDVNDMTEAELLETVAEEVMDWQDVEIDRSSPAGLQATAGSYKYLRFTWSCAGMVIDRMEENVILDQVNGVTSFALNNGEIQAAATGANPRGVFKAAVKAVRAASGGGNSGGQP